MADGGSDLPVRRSRSALWCSAERHAKVREMSADRALRPSNLPAVVGRDRELAEIARILRLATAGPIGLVLAGRAGIGKTTLLRWALAEAEGSGRRVLLAHPSETEAQLAFAGLVDLFSGVSPATLDGLPQPQRVALARALRQADGDVHVDPLAISQAALGLVRALAADGPLVLAVDDALWLDAPTTRVLEYVLRRLDREPVAVVVSARTPDGDPADAAVVRAIGHERLHRLDVGPLGVEALARLVGDRFGQPPRRALAVRMRELSGGNPFYALEIARTLPGAGAGALAGAGAGDLGDAVDSVDSVAIQVPETLGALVRQRLDRLTPGARDLVLVAATASQPSRAVVLEAAGGTGNPALALAEAIDAGVIEERQDGRISFSHPLLAWSAYAGAPSDQRLAAHRRLAASASDPDERIRHRAIAALEPDDVIAADLDAAADRARGCGAPETARDLELEALRLTSPGRAAEVRARTLAAAEFAIQAGDGSRARAILERYLAAAPPGPGRSRPLALLADIRSGDDWEAKLDLLRTARAEAGPDGADRAEIDVATGIAHWMLLQDIPAGIAHLRSGVDVANRGDDPAVRLRAIASLVYLEAFAGNLDGALQRLAAARDLEPTAPGLRLLFVPSYIEGLLLDWSDRPADARAAWLALLERADRQGDADSRPLILLNLSATEMTLGDWQAAARHLDEGEIASDLLGHDTSRAFGAAQRAHLEAHRGEVEVARAAAARGIELAAHTHSRMVEADCRAALAEAELVAGDPHAALRAVRPAAERLLAAGVVHSPGSPVVPLAAEAAALAGEIDEAERLLSRLRLVGTRLDHASTLRAFHRGRALVAAAQGHLEAALDASRDALRHADRVDDPFERARTLLVHGEIQRRLRQRAAAREAAAAALATFEALGARAWAERARSELARAGQPTGTGGADALTPTQREVAALVVAGRTNREVATTLFMSPHTVEAHLTSIYRALGIRSRTDLARVLPAIERADEQQSGGAAAQR